MPTANRTPLISIIVPVHGREELIAATLQSIQDQTLRDWECIIVDDGSPDGTGSVAKRYEAGDSRFRVITQPKSGSSAARNRGFAASNPGSKFVSFMDSDDVWLPDALSVLSEALEKDERVIGVHGLADFIDEAGNPRDTGEFADSGRERLGLDKRGRIRMLGVDEPTTFETLIWKNTVYPPGLILVRRIYYEKAGPFDSSLRRMDDWDMIIRVSRFGDLGFLNRVVIHYRRHGGNISARSGIETLEAIRALHHKTFFSPENTKEQRELAGRSWRAWQLMNMKDKLRTSRKNFASGRIGSAGRALAGTYIQIHRYLRGYPTLSGL